MNHEAITPSFLHPTGVTIVAGVCTVNNEVIKELNAHGISIIEDNKSGATFNRRLKAGASGSSPGRYGAQRWPLCLLSRN